MSLKIWTLVDVPTGFQPKNMWNGAHESGYILIRAQHGEDWNKDTFSDYALKNAEETVAEAAADFNKNRTGAAKLSREIWQILKEELKS